MIPSRLLRWWIALVVLVAGLSAPWPGESFDLLPEPPANRFLMTLSLGAAFFVSLDGVRTNSDAVAATALAHWNSWGVGPSLDRSFFSWAQAPMSPRCERDGINLVTMSPTKCGFGWGDAIASTHRWIVGGRTVQADVFFDPSRPWNYYVGPFRTIGGRDIYDLYRVALHEFGHVLGLGHPDEVGQNVVAIMNSRVDDVDRLQPDDVQGARAVQFFQELPTVAITTNAASYRTGDQMAVTITVAPRAATEPWYLALALVTPTTDASDFLLYRFSPSPQFTTYIAAVDQVRVTGSLAAVAARPLSTLGAESLTVLNQRLPLSLPEGFPSGSYQWQAALLSADGRTLLPVASAPFVFTQ